MAKRKRRTFTPEFKAEMEQREMVEALRTDFWVRKPICETLGFNRSNLYYHAKQDPCEVGLREEIERLSLLYRTYGYRRIMQLLVRRGYTIGYKRVARLMKSAFEEKNLS